MKNILFYISAIILLQGCGSIQRRLYSTNQPNNPSLQKKNDYSLSVTYGGPSGFDLNAGYAVSDKVAIIGGFYTQSYLDTEQDYFWLSPGRDSSKLSYRHNGFHAGAGVYLPLSQKDSDWFVSFFGGYTNGNFRMNEVLYHVDPPPVTSQTNFYKSRITRWFAQGSLNFYDKTIHQSFIARFNYVGYNKATTDYSTAEQEDYRLPPFGHPPWSQFLDLTVDTKLFFTKERRIGLHLFGTLNTRLNREIFNFPYYTYRIGAGIVVGSPFKIKEKKE
jgi:hypothetical protein